MGAFHVYAVLREFPDVWFSNKMLEGACGIRQSSVSAGTRKLSQYGWVRVWRIKCSGQHGYSGHLLYFQFVPD